MIIRICLLLILSLASIAAFSQAIKISNTAEPVRRSANYKWTVFVEATPAILNTIDHVEYLLDPTFKTPQVSSFNKDQKFGYTATGWGEFEIKVKIVFKGRLKPQYFNYWLKLKK